MSENLNPVQNEIVKAVKSMPDKSSFTEFVLIKKIRENTKLDGKKKAGLALEDLLAAFKSLETENLFYSIHINSVNECLIKKETESVELSIDAKQRRQKSEKSMSIITSADISENKGSKSKNFGHEKRNERKKLSINSNFDF